MKHFKSWGLGILFLAITGGARAQDCVDFQNLVVNGDFSAGFDGSFTSNYVRNSNLVPEGRYQIGPNPNAFHNGFAACGDHTTGNGNMMVVNGATNPGLIVWQQVVNVTPNTLYSFSAWLANVAGGNNAIMQFRINGVLLGAPFSTPGVCQWNRFFANWNSGANTTATITIVNQNTAPGGNDFALDDIAFWPCCVTNANLVVTPPAGACEGQEWFVSVENTRAGVTYSIIREAGGVVVGTPAVGNGGAILISGGTTATAGAYRVEASNIETACVAEVGAFNLSVNPLPAVSAPATAAVCAGEGVTLTAVGNATSYVWQPGDLTGASVVVTPSSSVVFTVTGTGAGGCTAAATTAVTVNDPPAVTVNDGQICSGQSFTLTASGAASYVWQPGNISGQTLTVSPPQTATYTVFGTGANGCTSAVAATVVVVPQPFPAEINDATICLGESRVYSVPPAESVVWNPGGLTGNIVTLSPTQTTTYTVVSTNGGVCSSSDVFTVSVTPVTVEASITTTNGDGNPEVCRGSTVMLNAHGGTTYFWTPPTWLSGTNGPIVSAQPLQTITYTVTAIKDGCSDTAQITVFVGACDACCPVAND